MIPTNVNRLLHVDLSSGGCYIEELDEGLYQRYLGGSGIAAKILYDRLNANAGAMDPESPIVFINGLLTGTFIPTANRMSVCARSPLTGIWCEATVGGHFPAELNRAGLGGIVIRGRADKPVYLWIRDTEAADIIECDDIWSLDTLKSSEILRERTDPEAQVAIIGQAGTNMVRLANIIFGGEDSRAAGRGGLGAVMGAKNLKAIMIRGTKKRRAVYDRKKLIAQTKEATRQIKEFAM